MPSPFEDTLEAIRASGGVALQNRRVGNEVRGFDFIIDTPAGLEFIAKHTVADEVSRSPNIHIRFSLNLQGNTCDTLLYAPRAPSRIC